MRKWLLLLLCITIVHCHIVNYDERTIDSLEVRAWRAGMFAPDDAPSKSAPGNGDSYIRTSIKIAPKDAGKGDVTVLVVNSKDRNEIGFAVDEKTQFCCTQEFVNAGKCQTANSLYINNAAAPRLLNYSQTAHFVDKNDPIELSLNIEVVQTERYYLMIANCMASEIKVTVKGRSTWMNPFGYLPGELYNYMPFFGSMAWFSGIAILLFVVLGVVHYSEILKLQYAIVGVMGIMLFENLFNYWRYSDYNTEGYKPLGLSTSCLLLNVARSTVSRVLALVVALGYGVVRPTLGGDSRKVQTLGLLYAICSLWYNFFEEIRTEQVVSNDILLLVILPLTTLDAIFYWWIFYALHRTLNQLRIRRQSAKLNMYKKYSVTLISAVISSVVMVLYQTFVLAMTTEDDRWQEAWATTAYWNVLFFAILLCIMYVWRPSKDSKRFAYSEELGYVDSEDEEDHSEVVVSSISERGGGTLQQRNIVKDKDVELGVVEESPEDEAPQVAAPTTPSSWDDEKKLNEEKSKLLASFDLEEEEDLSTKLD